MHAHTQALVHTHTLYMNTYCIVENIGRIKLWQIQPFRFFGGEKLGESSSNGKYILKIL